MPGQIARESMVDFYDVPCSRELRFFCLLFRWMSGKQGRVNVVSANDAARRHFEQ